MATAEQGQPSWRDAASPNPGPDYQPNEAWLRALEAKARMDAQRRQQGDY